MWGYEEILAALFRAAEHSNEAQEDVGCSIQGP